MSRPSLASEAIDGVQAALQELQRQADRLTATGDPIASAAAAMAEAVRASSRLILDASLTWQAQLKMQPVIDRDEVRRGVLQGVSAHMGGMVRLMTWRTWMAGAAGLFLAVIVSAGGGYWVGYQQGETSVAPFTAMTPAEAATWSRLMADNPGNAAASFDVCQAGVQRNSKGRRACSMPVWIDPPISAPAVR